MKISSNIPAMMGVNYLNRANTKASQAMQRLSSGLKINSAGDDAAGLAIAQKLSIQQEGISKASDNAMNGISLIQTAEGALNEVHDMLNRVRELTVQGRTGSLGDDDKQKIQEEIDALLDEIKSTAKNTEYNGIKILDTKEDIILQIGANANQIVNVTGKEIKLDQTLEHLKDFSIFNENQEHLNNIDKAIAQTSEIRGKLGAYQNRLEHTVANLGVSEENMTSSLSRIYDADMAEEMTNYTQYNVISQSAISMLAQANQRPQQVLQLLNS